MPRFVFVKPSLSDPQQRERTAAESLALAGTAVDLLLVEAQQAGYESILAVEGNQVPTDTAYPVVALPCLQQSAPSGLGSRLKSLVSKVLGRNAPDPGDNEPSPLSNATDSTRAPETLHAFRCLAGRLDLKKHDIVSAEVSPRVLREIAAAFRELVVQSPAAWHLLMTKDAACGCTLTEEDKQVLAGLESTLPNVRFFADSEATAKKARSATGLHVQAAPPWSGVDAPPAKCHTVLCMGGDSDARIFERWKHELGTLAEDCRFLFHAPTTTESCDLEEGKATPQPDIVIELSAGNVDNSDWPGVPVIAPAGSRLAQAAAHQVVAYHLEIFDRDCFVGAAELLPWISQLAQGESEQKLDVAVPAPATHALLSLEAPAIEQNLGPVWRIAQFDAAGELLTESSACFAAKGDLATCLVRVAPGASGWQLRSLRPLPTEVKSATMDFVQLAGEEPLYRAGVFYDSAAEIPAALREVLSNWSHYSSTASLSSSGQKKSGENSEAGSSKRVA